MDALLAVEQEFEKALISGNTAALNGILHDDLQMITPIGSVMTKQDLLGLMDAGILRFEGLDPHEITARDLGSAGVVTGKAHMRASMGEQKFEARTRYIHVYEKQGAAWRMLIAQGTQIAEQ